MAIQLGSAYGKVNLDVSGLLNGVKLSNTALISLSEKGAILGQSMQNAGKLLTLGLTLPIAGLGVAAIKAASDLNETNNKIKVVFGEMSDTVLAWAKDSATAFGLSKQAALEAAGTFGNLFTSMGLGQQESAKMSTSLVKLVADLASFNNLDPRDVLAKLQSGIVGETREVRDLGIDLRATVVEARAAQMHFEKVNGQFTEGALIAARYAIIMEQTKNAQGDFARTSDQLANSMRITKAEFQDALATLGQNLLPIALKVVQALNRMLEAFNNMSPLQQKMVIGFLAMVAAIGPFLFALGLVISIIAKIAGIVGVLGELGIGVEGIGLAISGTLLPAIIGVVGSLLPIILTVGAIILVLGLLYIAWKKNLFGIQDLVHKSALGYQQAWQRFTDWWRKNTADTGADVQASFAKMRENIQGSFSNMGSGLTSAWQNFTSWLRNSLSGLVGYIAKAFAGVSWSTLGKQILLGLANGLMFGLPNLLTIIANIANQMLAQIKHSLGIASPSKAFMQLGMYSSAGFALGLQRGMSPEEIAKNIARPVTSMNTSQQQNITANFASGLTLRDVRGIVDEKLDGFANQLITNLGGA